MARRKRKLLAKTRIRKAVKRVKKTLRAVKKLRTQIRKNKKRRQIDARKVLRAQQRQRTQLDLVGAVDISAATVTQASAEAGASRPGEPPKLRSGKGRSSIKAQLRLKGKKLESRVYVDKKIAPYMAMWEFRKDGEGRPFLKPSVENNKDQFGKLIGSELKQANRGGRKKAVVK